MKRKSFLNRKALLVAGLIALILCLTFTSCDVPEENDVTDITLNASTLNIAEGEYDYLYITAVQPAGATYTSVLWKSQDPTVATVKDGIITTLPSSATKTTTITAQTGKGSASCNVTITAPPTGTSVASVSLNKDEITLVKGDTVTLTPTVSPANASNKNVFYVSDDITVATVDGSGKIKAVSEGFATITVYSKNNIKRNATCNVIVEGSRTAVDEVTLDPATLSLAVGGEETLTPKILPTDAYNKGVTWSSSDSSKATVDDNGTVKGVAAGTATITVTTVDGGKTATCAVTVNASGDPVSGVTLNKTSISLAVDKSEILIATVSPTTATNKNVTWSSSNSGVAAVTAISGYGNVTAIAAGTATITVTTTDGSKTATCTVTVSDPSSYKAYFGKYSGKYTSGTGSSAKTLTETIEITETTLNIYDDENTGSKQDFLNFSITNWETAATPDSYKDDYPYAFKITGKITDAKPIDASTLYGSSTAPGFTQTDKNTTECWMYIYISRDGKIIRSPFSKAGRDNGTAPIITNTKLRIYSKITS